MSEGYTILLNSICGLAMKKKSIVYLPYIYYERERPVDKNDSSVYIPTSDERRRYKKSSWGRMDRELVFPLIVRGEAIGVLNIESDKVHDFKQEEIKLLANLTHAAAHCYIQYSAN